jgi:hypothetical protein
MPSRMDKPARIADESPIKALNYMIYKDIYEHHARVLHDLDQDINVIIQVGVIFLANPSQLLFY